MGWKDGLKNLEAKFEEQVKDATTLTVRTFKGGINAQFDTNKKEWVVTKEATATMIAMTEISLDGDVDLFLPMDANGNVDKELLALHEQAVKSGSEARAAVLKGIVELFRGLAGGS